MKKSLLSVLTVLFLSACAEEGTLTGASWRLTGLADSETGQLTAPEETVRDTKINSPITISFTDTQATGTACVNNFFSLVKIEGDRLNISNIGATRKAGSADMMKLEQHFFDTLIRTDRFEIRKDVLTLFDEAGAKLMTFAENRLENTAWLLTAVNDGSALVSSNADFPADIEFGKDYSVYGSDGVNRYFGSYTEKAGNAISFSNLGATLMAGPEEAMEAAERFRSHLQETAAFEISGSTLQLKNADGTIILVFTEKPQPEAENAQTK